MHTWLHPPVVFDADVVVLDDVVVAVLDDDDDVVVVVFSGGHMLHPCGGIVTL